MAKKSVTAEQVLEAFGNFWTLFEEYNGDNIEDDAAEEQGQGEPDEEEDEEDQEAPTREQVEKASKSGIKDLRALAGEYGISVKKKAEILEAFEDLYDEEESEDEDEDEEPESEEEDDEEEWTRDDLEDLSLKDLRKAARDAGWSASDYKGMGQDEIVNLILGESEDDDEDEEEEDDEEPDDEDDEDEEDSDEEEDEYEELDPEDLEKMSNKELINLCDELGLTVPKKVKSQKGKTQHKSLYDLIIAESEED